MIDITVLDDLRETFAEHIPGDTEFRLKAERFVVESCRRRAAQLFAEKREDRSGVGDRVSDEGGAA